MSKGAEVEQFPRERPVHQRPRRLAEWLNPTGAKKVHSLIDKVYQPKNLKIAWERVEANQGAGGVDGQSITAFGERLDELLGDEDLEIRRLDRLIRWLWIRLEAQSHSPRLLRGLSRLEDAHTRFCWCSALVSGFFEDFRRFWGDVQHLRLLSRTLATRLDPSTAAFKVVKHDAVEKNSTKRGCTPARGD